jgi:hypothetical protein
MEKGITIEIDNDTEELTALYNSDEYKAGVKTHDVETYWTDSDIKEAIAEMNYVSDDLVTVKRI